MKKYYQFIKENNSNNFVFAINIKTAYDDDIDMIFKLAETHFKKLNMNYDEFKIMTNRKTRINPPWAIILRLKDDALFFSTADHPKWLYSQFKETADAINNIITIDEFFKIGFDNIEEYIDAKKFNL